MPGPGYVTVVRECDTVCVYTSQQTHYSTSNSTGNMKQKFSFVFHISSQVANDSIKDPFIVYSSFFFKVRKSVTDGIDILYKTSSC